MNYFVVSRKPIMIECFPCEPIPFCKETTVNCNKTACFHGTEPNNVCKKCGGLICQHAKRKSRCIECAGSQLCQHNKMKQNCKECGGSAKGNRRFPLNKHTDYDCSCENKRLMEISRDLNDRPIVFIRFNPDDYTNEDGVCVKSCWKVNKLGIMQITKAKEGEWHHRINCLKEQIHYWVDNPSEKMVEIIQLFY